MVPYHARYVKGFGESFKNQVRFLQPGFFVIGGWGKVIAKPENRVTVDSKHLDAYRIREPRDRDRAYGQRCSHLGAERAQSGARGEKPVRRRRELLHHIS